MSKQPPGRALGFLRWFCREDYLDEIEGDLTELFEKNSQVSSRLAKRRFWWQVMLHFRPAYIKSFSVLNPFFQQAMLKNNIKLACRHIFKKKLFSFINISGLGLGMACCMLILLYVSYELSYDRYHANLPNMYRVLHAYRQAGQAEQPTAPHEFQVWGGAQAADLLQREFPEVEEVFRFTSPVELLFRYEEKRFQEEELVFADPAAFQVFSWNLLAGNPATALTEPYSIVITRKLAGKYFGEAEALGKMFDVGDGEFLKVTGVMENVPSNSHFTFSGLISMSTFQQSRPQLFEMWDYVDFYTYFTVKPGADVGSLEQKAREMAQQATSHWKNTKFDLALEPVADAYLNSQAARQPGETGSLQNLYIFSSVAVFVLLLACINFINLSTARSLERAREVGIRKMAGARQYALSVQFLSEFVVLTLLAAMLAIIITVLSQPLLQNLTGKPVSLLVLLQWKSLYILPLLVLLVSLLAGLYPAAIMTRFNPAKVLKGTFATSGQGALLRKGLVVLQFSLSIALIAGTGIVFSQLQYLRNHDLGFQARQMVVDFAWDDQVQAQMEAIKNTLLQHPDVESVTASRAVPGNFLPNAGTSIQAADGEMLGSNPLIYEIDDNFVQHYGIEVVAGRAFSPDFPNDTLESLMLNEAAVKQWGYTNPEDIIGKPFSQWGKEGIVVGVVANFHFQSLHSQVAPLSLRYDPRSLRKLSIRLQSDDLPRTVAELQSTWNSLVPHRPFLYSFLDETFNQHYQADARFGKLFGVFAAVAIFIACLGLFGLTAYTTGQRTKEIGIRKVMGATAGHIVALVSGSFAKMFLVALLFAIPASWYGMHHWLQGFAYRTSLAAAPFVIAGAVSGIAALVTVGWLSLKAALANPVHSLRSE